MVYRIYPVWVCSACRVYRGHWGLGFVALAAGGTLLGLPASEALNEKAERKA